ncbi:ABC-type xenobiotic transporter [Entamoeba marina]
MEWYDKYDRNELSSRIASDIQVIQDGMSFKLGLLIKLISCILSCYIVGFILSWDLTLVIMTCSPLLLFSMFFLGYTSTKLVIKSQNAFGEAGIIAEETIGNVRTVHSLSKENDFVERYNQKLNYVSKMNVIRFHCTGAAVGFMLCFGIACFSLTLWYGSLIIQGKVGSNKTNGGGAMVVFFAVLQATQALGTISITLNAISLSRATAFKIYNIIDRIPEIDVQSIGGIKPNECNGHIKLDNIQFTYPTRVNNQVIEALNLEIKKGECIALVGESGCGKSTIIQLIERLYDPTNGKITLDGNDLRELNIEWLRNQIGLVQQEPILFSGTIKENILLGAIEGIIPTEDDLLKFSKMANAHDFITQLPDGYNTLVGEKGMLLSGGQKQRIAIARALIRNPSILLLDEATSALDTQSEKIVQDALDKAAKGRTTIIVAHRLSTIKNASTIYVLHQGRIIENGTHEELLNMKGIYYGLVNRQNIEDEEKQKLDKKEINEEIKMNEGDYVIEREETTIEPLDNVSQIEKDYEKEIKDLKKSNRFAFVRLFINNITHEYVSMPIGFICGIAAGCIFPSYSIFVMEVMLQLLSLSPDVDITEEQHDIIQQDCLKLFAISIGALLTSYLYLSMFSISGEHLLNRIYSKLYSSIIHQDISWFDRKENMVGILTTKLSADPSTLRGICGEQLANIVQLLSLTGFSIGFALWYDWRITLGILSLSPIVVSIVVINGKLNAKMAAPSPTAYEEAGGTMVQTIEGIKTVQTLGRLEYFYSIYKTNLHQPKIRIIKYAPFISLSNALVSFSIFGMYAYSFFIGVLIIKKTINFNQSSNQFNDELLNSFISFMKIMMMITFVNDGISNFVTILPNISKALSATKRVFNLIDRIPKIDTLNKSKLDKKLDFNSLKSTNEIQLNNVCFRYPSRPENPVLKGISFKASQGKTIALVGKSGCGKSTIIQLIERFYDVTAGEILFGGINTKELNIHFLRNQIGLVQQEPILFDESIIDNIKRGVPDEMNISNDQIYNVAKMANAHDFISVLPDGYNTLVGNRGSQLSGGQKQRIAIARALIRNPSILLLDEATSALDTQSEKIVQDALDKAAKGRTTIIVAHRLSTIKM